MYKPLERKSALVTGATGQDGRYLIPLLVSKGYVVHGIAPRSAQDREIPECNMHYGDITDGAFVSRVVQEFRPTEVYNLAAMSHVGESFRCPAHSLRINAEGAMNVLEAAYRVGSRFYQASTSELFGDSPPPQDENTPMRPRSPYGCAKLAAYWAVRTYRERGMYAVNGILFNHESPLRSADFVTQKVARGVVEIEAGVRDKIELGNLDSKRDWGHAKDFVKGMWMMLQQWKPEDYVLATGKTRTIRELLDVAFGCIGITNWQPYIAVNPALYRPVEVENLLGNPEKARKQLGWEPTIKFEDMIREMVEAARATVSARNKLVG